MSIVDRIKSAFKDTIELLEEENFAAPSPDLKVSDMVVGGKVEVVNDDQTLSPVADGEYTVGENVLVVKEGLIVSINGEEAAPEKEVEEEMESAVEEVVVPNPEIEALKSEVNSLKVALDEMKGMFSTLQEKVTADNAKEEAFAAQLKELNDTIKALAVTPAEFSKTNKSNKVKDATEQKKNDLYKILTSL